MTQQDNDRSHAKRPDPPARRPYAKPALVEYGSIAKLTLGTSTNQSDGVGGGFKMTCL